MIPSLTMSRAWKTIVWILVTAGCSYQTYKITSLFLEHDTVNQVLVGRGIFVQPPKIVICLDDYNALLANRSAARIQATAEINGRSPQAILNLTISTDDVVTMFGYSDGYRSVKYDSPSLVTVEKYLKIDIDICYTLVLPSHLTVTDNQRNRRNRFSNELMSFHLTRPFLSGELEQRLSW